MVKLMKTEEEYNSERREIIYSILDCFENLLDQKYIYHVMI